MTPAGIEPATFRFVARVPPFCSVRYLIIICFSILFSNHSTCVFWILCKFFLALYFCFPFCVFVLILLLCCPCPIFVQVYRPLPPGGNQIAVNKYHIVITRSCPKTRHHHFLCQPFRALLNYVIQYTPLLSGLGNLVSENSRFSSSGCLELVQ